MSQQSLLSAIVSILVFVAFSANGASFETESLIIRDITGSMPPERFEKLVPKVESTFTEVLRFWSTEARVQQFGKIIVEFDHSLGGTNSALFFWGNEGGRKPRVVRVFGGDESPQMLAHKLTSAVFPNPDKLIRNMMGEASEKRFGNPLTFPRCGFDTDDWLMALQQVDSYIPLANLGPDHSDWGMEVINNAPRVRDRPKQHASYLEAGSFGEFLIDTFGIENIKQFNRLSRDTPRPWKEVFGVALERLEATWLEALRLRARERQGDISTLVRLLRVNPTAACASAQRSR